MSTKIFIGLVIGLFFGSIAQGKSRKVMFAAPLTVEAPWQLGLNLENKLVGSLEFVGVAQDDDLSKTERKEQPGAKMSTRAVEGGLMFSRFSNPQSMSGWHLGLGFGFRRAYVDWKTGKETQQHLAELSGPTITTRTGWRYVGDDLGFLAGIFLSLKHFQNIAKEQKEAAQPLSAEVKDRLQRRFMTSMYLGLEAGWAF